MIAIGGESPIVAFIDSDMMLGMPKVLAAATCWYGRFKPCYGLYPLREWYKHSTWSC